VAPRTQLGVRLTKALRHNSAGESSEAADFGQLFDRHAQAVYAFCARRTADLAWAEDLTSITFLEAWRHRDRVPSVQVGHALPWLLAVANNVVRNARRGQGRYRAALESLPASSVVPPAEDQAVARSVTEAGLRAALVAISVLPEGEREVVMLVLWSGLSYEEAATALAIPVGTVQSRLSRARAKLQISLSTTAHAVLKESS
jgi:RNA polymerase sigma factor (sigma-70 family)